ncbi:MAG: hypothetical protein ACLR9T_11540 [Thomasclavelia sp.]|uniref:hypothetical protein n=1 Tax=Thomasclavelia sp. TaxID=3025757 RepID=UPI0039A0840C
MKKIIKLLLAFFIVFTITACSTEKEKEPLKISFEKENKFEKLVSYNIESIGTPKQITPDTIGTVYTYYKPQKDTNVLLDLVINMKNLKKSDLDIKKTLAASFIIGEDEYAASIATLSEDGSSLKQNGTIQSEGTSKVHFYAEVSPKKVKKDIEFKITTNDKENPQEANVKFKLDDIKKNYEVKNINEVITIENRSEITLQAANITKELTPANPEGLYTYYKVKADTNSFVVLTTMIKNISTGDLSANNVVVAKLIDKNDDEYPASIFFENEARNDLAAGSSTTIATNQSAMIHFVFEMPDNVVNDAKMIRISYQGKVFAINI